MGGEEGGPPRSTVGILVNCTQRRALDVARQTAWFRGNILGLSGSTLSSAKTTRVVPAGVGSCQTCVLSRRKKKKGHMPCFSCIHAFFFSI